jgi:hypothetical protein
MTLRTGYGLHGSPTLGLGLSPPRLRLTLRRGMLVVPARFRIPFVYPFPRRVGLTQETRAPRLEDRQPRARRSKEKAKRQRV